MSNARELALLEKWTSSSDGATILPALSSPTSPKATKFCCCPNRRRYQLKQPKLTTTLHVRNIFVDNDFNFIDDNTTNNENNDDDTAAADGEELGYDEELLTYDCRNYKRAESWPSARRSQKNSNNNNNNNTNKLAKLIEAAEVHKENRRNQKAVTPANDYDDIVEIATSNLRLRNGSGESPEKVKVVEAEKEWRHDKSCHNNRNNCLTNDSDNNSRCSIESFSQQEQLPSAPPQGKHQQTLSSSPCARKPPRKPSGNDASEASALPCGIQLGENLQNSKTLSDLNKARRTPLITANEQTTSATSTNNSNKQQTSPLIQRLSELSEFKHSLCKETFSNITPTPIPTPAATATATTPQHNCNNCQFCFNQSCRNFSQLQQSLQDSNNDDNSNNNNNNPTNQVRSRQQSSTFSDNQKMTITTATNVANNFKRNAIVANSPNDSSGGVGGMSSNCGLASSATATPTTRTQTPPSSLKLASTTRSTPSNQNNTPASPLTTTVIKTTMVKRSPANESTTPLTPSATTSPTSATSASLTLEKSLAFITASPTTSTPPSSSSSLSSSNAVHDFLTAKENKPANNNSNNNKCSMMDATGPALVASNSSSTPLSVKERIAALVAGNEQIHKQHDNFINRTSIKNQCNKPLRSTSQQQQQQQSNMTCPQPRQQHEQSMTAVMGGGGSGGGNSSSNMCQKSPSSSRVRKFSFATDEVDGSSATTTNTTTTTTTTSAPEEEDINDNINHRTSTPSVSTSSPASSGGAGAVQLRSSKPTSADTIPRCSLPSNHLQYHNAAVNKYGSNAMAATSSSTAGSACAASMTVETQPQRSQQRTILSNTTLKPTAAAAAVSSSSPSSASSSNDTSGDSTQSDLTAAASTPSATTTPPLGSDEAAAKASSCRSKLAALANLDLALNLSNLPLDVDDDDDPYFVLQEYLERVKHEINEVFELHKARQKLQQQQEQELPPFESDTNKTTTTTAATAASSIENQIIDTLKAAVSNDELSRSTESDSGFDSATGGGWRGSGQTTALTSPTTTTSTTTTTNVGSNKLPSRAKVTTTTGNANRKDNDTRVMETASKNELPSEAKTPPKVALIPSSSSREQGKQEQDAGATASLPYSSSSSSTSPAPSSLPASSTTTSPSSSTLKRLRKQLQTKSPAEVATDDVNMWANKFLRDLDNLMASDKATTTSSSALATTTSATAANRNSISPGPTSPMLLSAAATAVIQSRYGKGAHDRYVVGNNSNSTSNNTSTTAVYDHQPSQGSSPSSSSSSSSSTNGIVLRPEKHATIPLQSFNLDCGRLDNSSAGGGTAGTSSGGNVTKTNVAYLRTLSAPTPSPSHTIYQALLHNHDPGSSKATCGSSSSSSNNRHQRNSLAAAGGGGGLFNAAAFDHHQNSNLTNFQQSNEAAATVAATDMSNGDIKSTMSSAASKAPTTILKIEETTSKALRGLGSVGAPLTSCPATTAPAASSASEFATDVESLHQKRLRQLNMEMDNLRNTSIDQSQQLSALMQQNHYCTGGVHHGHNSSNSGGNKHKTLMTTSSCAMPKKASPITSPAAAAATSSSSSSSMSSSSIMTCSMAGSRQLQPAMSTATATTSYLLHGSDATKKGSTSTIWTSEESILRSVGAVDEDNNSTSSSACEEASGVLSSGKSGISLDSSGVENDNNESGIGTATPPKDMSYWKSMPQHHRHHHHHHHHHHNQQDNESVSSLDALRKMKFQKGSSVTSSDDPDLLEVLSLCDETPHHDGDVEGDDDADTEELELEEAAHNNSIKSAATNEEDMDDYDMVDEEDEGHDEFEVVPYCDCDCTEDGEASSASAGSSGTRTNGSINNGSLSDSTNSGGGGGGGSGVVLRRKYAASPIMVPQPKCRSHSLDTSSLPNSYHQQQHVHGAAHGPMHGHVHQAQLARKLQHYRDRQKDRDQLSLALRQEPFQSLLAPTHFHELPSPSSASLHSGHEILDTQELSTKSNSAPLLLKQEKRLDDFANQNVTLRYSRSQSDRYLAEIEAVEACKWLRAAGFPQYAQMYEDHQFPLDLTNVAKDHTNLENDQLQSLYRRLCILNRCANMRVDQSHKAQSPQKEDSDDENFALSENWTFQPHIRRWSRIGEMGLEIPPAAKLTNCEKTESSSKESSPDRFEDDGYDVTGAPLSLALPGSCTDDSADPALNDSTDLNASPLRRTGSERLKDGAKAILRRVESIKSRRRKRQGIVLSGPQALELSQLGQRTSVRKPDGIYSTPPSPSAVSPMHSFNKGPLFGNELKVPSQSDNFLSPNRSSPKRTPTTPRSMRTSPLHFLTNTMPYVKEGKSDDSSSYYSDSQESSSAVNKMSIRKTPSKARRFLQRTGKVDDIGAHSDSECHQGRKLLIKDANANTTEVKTKKLSRGGSLNLGRDGKKRDGFRSASFRSRSTTRKEPKPEEMEPVKKTPVVRWHSFQLEERPHMIFRKCFAQKNDPHSNEHGILFAAMSAGQLQMIRKLALVTLTGYMERYCPTHRSGWNWELPKFIKKIKMPDYKEKRVFGVPLLLILQRSGQTLPIAVRAAFRWLQLNALDQIGLFRKSGVKSRILKLKELIEFSETSAECMDVFDTQQAYDVADMLKQYFRDLPESLLTTKMSETFAAIFQHLPPEVRLDAVQSAVLLLPDENREILFALLEFLTLVAANSQYNQMTANNLAVCLAPSLFHSSISTGSNSVTASPRRKGKGSGVPDAKELFEAKASHECLAFMIQHYKQIYTAPKEKLGKCKFGYMEESKPLPLEALGEGMQFHNWRGYLYESTSATIKEGREKSRGWITTTSLTDPNVEIAYKKVGDGHPLRLWRCITEIEGPPKDVLDYIIRQRASWDPNLLQSQTIKKFDDCTEIFQYAIDGQQCTDFCVLRSWRTDLPRGACVIVETSIDHAKAKPMFNAVRGVVLASRYLIEPCGSGRSRVMHLARVDVKGKTPEWYNKSYGHISSHFLTRIRLDFKNVAELPESKV